MGKAVGDFLQAQPSTCKCQRPVLDCGLHRRLSGDVESCKIHLVVLRSFKFRTLMEVMQPVIGPLNKRPDCTFQFRRTDPRWHYPILAGGHNIRSTTVKEYPENILKWPATWSLGTCFNVHESHRIARHFQETENR